MIYIKKNELNRVVLTLFESTTLINPFYLFEFKNEFILNSEPIYWSQTDISTSFNRYNLFNLIESATGSTTGGTFTQLNLIGGQYNYNVYESSATTLSITETTGKVIESGRMIVTTTPFTTDGVEINNIYK